MSWHRTSRFFSWLGELRLLYLAGLYVLLGFALIRCFDVSEQSIRLVGLGLQVLGIGTVIWGISTTRKQFGHPPVINLMLSWIRRCPLIRRAAYFQADGISVGASIVGGRLTNIFVPNPTAPLEERLKSIEHGIETVQKRIESVEAQVDKEASSTHQKILVETWAREKADKEIMAALESSSTGGIYISAIGALWLFVGVVLSTASNEIAR